jgi:TonB-linked SusC/RagA family outer membrane protein
MTKVLKKIKKRSLFLQKTTLLTFLMISSFILNAQQEKIVLKGKVFDEKTDEVVIGANIKIKGQAKGEQTVAVTNTNGSFILNVSKLPATLVINYVGYKEQEIDVYEYTDPITISLSQDINSLNEVVVVGYGAQKRKELTGAISTIPDSYLKQSTTSFDNALGGAVAGLNVTQSSGQPGSTSTLRIRGGNSITGGNEPLYVIDGYILYNDNSATRTGAGSFDGGLNPLASINESDIESIEVLKDVSATAIYGSRGANGVIIITTKKGEKGKNNITYQTTFGTQTVRKKLDLLDAKQWAQLYTELKGQEGETGFTDAQINSLGQGADWQGAALQTGHSQNHQLTISGGDEKTRYLVSGNYTDQTGIVKNTDYDKIGARVNIDRKVSKSFNIGLNASGSSSDQNGLTNYGALAIGGRASGPFDLALRTSPLVSVNNPEGSFNYSNPYETSDLRYGTFTVNPISDIVNTQAITKLTNVIGNFFANYTILPSLVAKVVLGADLNSTKQDFYAPSTSAIGLLVNGLGSVGFKESDTWQSAFTLNYNKTFNDHSIDALVGYTTQKSTIEYATATSTNFSNESLTYNDLAAGSVYGSPTSGGSESVLNSYIGRVNYSFKERYNLTATLRADGSSRFAEDHRWGYFPSLGLSWNINQEPFFKSKDISNFKLRVSGGTVGNQEIGDYKYLATYGASSYSFGNSLVTAYTQNNAANPNLKWETTSQYNIGTDLGLWNDRLSFVLDVYDKNTSNLLVNIPVAATTGFSTQLENVGSVSNKGIEFAVNGSILKSKNVNWTVSANIAHNVNEVTSLGTGVNFFLPTFDASNSSVPLSTILPLIVKVGQPLGSFYGYQFAGVVQKGDDLSKVAVPSWFSQAVQPGDPKYVDQNHDGQITEADKVVLGNSQPDFTYGFSTTFNYKSFDVSVLFQGSQGNKLYNALRQNLETTSSSYNSAAIVADRWTPTNPSTTVPRAVETSQIVLDSRYIEDASFLKLKNLTVGFTFPFKITQNKDSKLRIFLSAQNLLTFTKYKGLDPEASRYGGDETNSLYQGIDLGAYPSSIGFNIGASVTL